MSLTTLARRIRAIRYSKGWGPDELADRAKISRTALYQIECGKTETPRAGTLIRIARALGLTVEDLLAAERGQSADRTMLAATMQSAGIGLKSGETVSGKPQIDGSRGDSNDLVYQMLSGQTGPLTISDGLGSTPLGPGNLEQKLRELLDSPLAESISRLIEESHRMLPPREVQAESWSAGPV